MPTIQSADLWKQSGRYDAYGPEMLRITDRHDREMLFSPTAEELFTAIFQNGAKSYRDLPRNIYQIQWKFRDEVRPRFGVLRGREFLMKDAYSFDLTQADAIHSYNKMFVAYLRTFDRLGLRAIPMRADTGPIGGNHSHEFIILADTGESEVFCHKSFVDFDIPAVDTDFDVGTDPPMGLGDAMLTYSLLHNLVKNACEAAPERSRVSATLYADSPLRIEIVNKGVIPEPIRERFFDKFVTDGKAGGTGLGTYSARLLARA
eukprot:gene38450-43558_t